MRFVLLGLILLSLPVFIAWLQSSVANRNRALMLLGFLVFVTGRLQIDAALITWPLWNGTSRGMVVSPADTLALALLLTGRRSGGSLPFVWIVGLYGAMIGLSMIFSRLPLASFFSFWDFARCAVAFVAVGREIIRPGAYTALVKGLACGLILQAGYVIEQKATGAIQATGTLVHQNLLGMLAEIAFLNVFGLMLEGGKGWILRLGALSGALIIAAGGSRGALAIMTGASAILMLVSLIRRPTRDKWMIVGAAAAIGALTAPVAVITLQDRFGGISVLTEENQRAAMEDAARAMSQANPLGVGANLYTNVSNLEGFADRAGVAWNKANRSVPVHNAYLLARAETGYHGEIAFILLLAFPCAAGLWFSLRSKRGPLDGQALGCAVAIGAVAVHNLFEFQIMTFAAMFPLMLTLGALAGRIKASRTVSVETGQPAEPRLTAGVNEVPVVPAVSTPRILQ